MALDLSKFSGVLPYDSQVYGIYQPVLGWKSSIQTKRITRGLTLLRRQFLLNLTRRFTAGFAIESSVPDAPKFSLDIAQATSLSRPPNIEGLDSLVASHVLDAISKAGADDAANWRTYTSVDYLRKALHDVQAQINSEFLSTVKSQPLPPLIAKATANASAAYYDSLLSSILRRESIAAGVLSQLNKEQDPDQIKFALQQDLAALPEITPILQALDPAHSDMARATLSPIGVAHLFREYFFEFATFLGPPVQHLWLSPGGTVELVEISTRKVTIERTTEQSLESTTKSEKDTTTQDELSDAVKQDNSSDTKLGVSATSNTNASAGQFLSESASVTGSFNLDQQQKQAREQTHKSTRQQTQKLSSEIKQNYKSTFKTVTETTDTTSKRYVLQNPNGQLMNYELRRKMRQVGVQLQDYGTRLCWQTFVDDPGETLGVSELVHAAPTPDLQSIKCPEDPPDPEPIVHGDAIIVRGSWNFGDDSQENFVPIGNDVAITPPAGYVCYRLDLVKQDGPPWAYVVWPQTLTDQPIRFNKVPDPVDPRKDSPGIAASIKTVGDPAQSTDEDTIVYVKAGVWAGGGISDNSQNGITLQVTPLFKPSRALLKGIDDTKKANQKNVQEQTKAAFQKAMFDTIRERVKFALNIQQRPFDDLREEERIVVFRQLIVQLLGIAGITNEDPHVRHVFSEIVESMFDMDSMLYFVAPDWWMPRQPISTTDALQGLGTDADSAPTFIPGKSDGSSNVVGWGGPRGDRANNYYITEDSATAKLGSSLGWLLQLDGDNFRNAFLNAPWVKAVIPIREGHEWDALKWLQAPSLEGTDGLDAIYQQTFEGEVDKMLAILRDNKNWPDPSLAGRFAGLTAAGFTILDAIRYLIVAIQQKQEAGKTKVNDPSDPTLSYLPTDMVYEHGFDPLAGGFVAERKTDFEVFDQWIEVLPTDQIVPVEVKYDPKTGLQI